MTRLFHAYWERPLFMAIPGMILTSSEAFRPSIGRSASNWLFSVWRVSPVSSGVVESRVADTCTCAAGALIRNTTSGMFRLSPWLKTMCARSQTSKPGAEIAAV